jgi:hypothetical protein
MLDDFGGAAAGAALQRLIAAVVTPAGLSLQGSSWDLQNDALGFGL